MSYRRITHFLYAKMDADHRIDIDNATDDLNIVREWCKTCNCHDIVVMDPLSTGIVENEFRTKKVYCPVNGYDCPYYHNSECAINNPWGECDDFAYFWNEDDDYLSDEPRTVFEEEC